MSVIGKERVASAHSHLLSPCFGRGFFVFIVKECGIEPRTTRTARTGKQMHHKETS